MKNSMTKYEQLTAALEQAKIAAQPYAKTEDGGTCNMDSPSINYHAMQMSKGKAEEAIRAAGLYSYDWKHCGGTYLIVDGIGHGQGNRNTRMAEAAEKCLKAAGISTCMYYQMN